MKIHQPFIFQLSIYICHFAKPSSRRGVVCCRKKQEFTSVRFTNMPKILESTEPLIRTEQVMTSTCPDGGTIQVALIQEYWDAPPFLTSQNEPGKWGANLLPHLFSALLPTGRQNTSFAKFSHWHQLEGKGDALQRNTEGPLGINWLVDH